MSLGRDKLCLVTETTAIIAEVAQRVADRITEVGRTPADVAAAAGVTQHNVHNPGRITLNDFVALSLALETTPAALLGGAK